MKLDYKKDFAVFILSHNRALKIDTLDMLERYKYCGLWYIVISTDDQQIDEYKKRIAEQNLLIFDKKEIIKECDTFISDIEWSASLYARNFINKYAKQIGLKYFVQADDDITKIFHRQDANGKMKQKEIGDINEIIINLINFMERDERITEINPALSSGFFGGINGNYSIGLTRLPYQFMIFKTKNIRPFRSIRTEDYILSIQNKDLLYFTYWKLSFESPKQASNKGGIEYIRQGKLSNFNMFLLIQEPSAITLLDGGKKKMYVNRIFPKIIREKHKKI